MNVQLLRRRKMRLKTVMASATNVEVSPRNSVPSVAALSANGVAGEENTSQKLYEIFCRRDLSQCCRNSSETDRLRCV